MRITIASTIVIMFARHVEYRTKKKIPIISSLMLTTSFKKKKKLFFMLFLNKMKTESRSQDICLTYILMTSFSITMVPNLQMCGCMNEWKELYKHNRTSCYLQCRLIISSYIFNFQYNNEDVKKLAEKPLIYASYLIAHHQHQQQKQKKIKELTKSFCTTNLPQSTHTLFNILTPSLPPFIVFFFRVCTTKNIFFYAPPRFQHGRSDDAIVLPIYILYFSLYVLTIPLHFKYIVLQSELNHNCSDSATVQYCNLRPKKKI